MMLNDPIEHVVIWRSVRVVWFGNHAMR